MSVKIQTKIPNGSFIITAGRCHLWGFGVYGKKIMLKNQKMTNGTASGLVERRCYSSTAAVVLAGASQRHKRLLGSPGKQHQRLHSSVNDS